MEKYVQKRFGAIAVEKSFITEDQLVEALKTQATENVLEGKHRRLGEILQEKGLLNESQIELILEAMTRTMEYMLSAGR